MKKLMILIMVSALLTGCASKGTPLMREPDELEMIRTLGVDKSDTGYTVTIATGMGIDGSPAKIRRGDGLTIAGALDVLQKTSRGREPFYSHTEHVIIGRELAKSGIDEVLDFMARSSEMRIDTGILLAKNSTAEELMTGASGEDVDLYEMLKVIEEEAPALGRGYMFTCLDMAAGLEKDGHALVLAAELSEGDGMEEEKAVEASGFGVIEDGRLTEYVSPEDAAGVTLLLGELTAMNLMTETDSGRIGIAAENMKADVTPVFSGGEPQKLVIGVKSDVSITEAGGVRELTAEKTLKGIEKSAADEIFRTVERAVANAQRTGIDYIGLGNRAELRAPVEFREMKRPWDRVFPGIPVELRVSVFLRRSYDLEESLT